MSLKPIANSDYVEFLKLKLQEFIVFRERAEETHPDELHDDIIHYMDDSINRLEDDISYFDDYHTYDPG